MILKNQHIHMLINTLTPTNLRIMKKYIVATRPSLLAYTQTEQTVNLLRAKNPDCEFEIVKFSTHGDKVTDKPLTSFGGTGVFVKELENAIIEGQADFAVHSLKDVPSIQPEGFTLACFPKREDVRDVLLTRNNISINELSDNCIVGTGSPRRMLQIKQFKDLRGNIDTRIQKLQNGEYDAILLAAAGLKRLGKTIDETTILSTELSIPAIGQGCIAIECKTDNSELINILRSINDKDTELAIIAERSYMKTIGGGCKFPLGAYAFVENNQITLNVMIGNHHTSQIIRFSETSSIEKAEELGIELAHRIEKQCDLEGITIER